MKEPGEKEKPEAEKNFLKKPLAEPAVLAGISLLYAAALLIIAGVRVGMYYFPGSSAFYTRIQLDSLLEGCFKLSSSITELQFDTAWYNGGVQQIWGLGTALWTMPFEWISWFFGRTSLGEPARMRCRSSSCCFYWDSMFCGRLGGFLSSGGIWAFALCLPG